MAGQLPVGLGRQKGCYVVVSWLVAAGAAGRWLLVGWLAGFLRQGVHTKMLISWQARVLERKCRFRGPGGFGRGRSTPPSSTPDPNKTSVGCKDETAQRGYFQQVDCFVASLVRSCSSCVLWVVAIAVVVVVVAVGSRCCCCGSIRTRTRTGPPPLISPFPEAKVRLFPS